MDNCPSLFITGTDTGIGKTYFSRLIADCSASMRKTVFMKPVQTGCIRDAANFLRAPDFETVMAGDALMNGTYKQHVPYRFEPACSPHLAAALAGQKISLDHIRECFSTVSHNMGLTLIEGSGGILAPLGETTYIVDLIAYLNLPAIVVASPFLGTLNHTFLTLRVLHESGVRIAGVVLTYHRNVIPSFVEHENRRIIEAHTHPIPLLVLPFEAGDLRPVKEFCDAIVDDL